MLWMVYAPGENVADLTFYKSDGNDSLQAHGPSYPVSSFSISETNLTWLV